MSASAREFVRGQPVPVDEAKRRLEVIKDGRRRGLSWSEIAAEYGISSYSLQAWWRRHGDEGYVKEGKGGITIRPCMCCRKPFESEGFHNRMCIRCRYEH